MRKIQPYKSLDGALRALDNGGRFFNVFTKAGDHVVTAAELKKVAGVLGNDVAAAMFYALAISDLDDTARLKLRNALGPKASDLVRRIPVRSLTPETFAVEARAGKPCLVEGRVKKFKDVKVTGMIFMPISTGKTTMIMPIPTEDHYTVYELDGPNPERECLVLTPKSHELRGVYRFAGLPKEAQVECDGETEKRLRLQPSYYYPIS